MARQPLQRWMVDRSDVCRSVPTKTMMMTMMTTTSAVHPAEAPPLQAKVCQDASLDLALLVRLPAVGSAGRTMLLPGNDQSQKRRWPQREARGHPRLREGEAVEVQPQAGGERAR